MGLSAPSVLMIQNWKDWLIDQKRDWSATQRDFDMLRKWANMDLMKSDKSKSKVLPLGRNNTIYQYMLGPTNWKSASQRRS